MALWPSLVAASSPASEVPTLAQIRERDFQVTRSDGTTARLNDLLSTGRPVVLEFWATWCAPCRKTLPHLVALQRDHGDALTVVGLTVEDPREDGDAVREYVQREGVDFPVAFAPRELFQFMNNRDDIAVPKLFVFDSEGNIVEYIPRYSPFTGRRLENAVREAMAHRP